MKRWLPLILLLLWVGSAEPQITPSNCLTIQDEGTRLACTRILNFTGAGATCTTLGPVVTCNITSGGGSGTVTNTGTLTLNQLILGNGTADVKALGSLGTTTTLLHGNAAGAPSFGAVSLTADVTGTLPFGNGGTGVATAADDTILVSSGAAWIATAVNDCTGSGKALTYIAASNSFGCNTISGSGTVTTTGSPADGNLTKFSGATSITNGDLSGDVTTSGTLATSLKATGTAGTYTKVTFDAQGRETSGAAAVLASSDFANQGTTTTVLHGAAAGNPSFGAVVSADLNITGTTCTNQFVSALSSAAAGTCTAATLASAQFANQGTTTTVLHGNAAGNPSFAGIAIADLTATGTPDGTTFLRGDNTWATPGGSGNVTAGTLAVNTIPKATGATAIADSLLTDNGTTLGYTGTGGASAVKVALTANTNQIALGTTNLTTLTMASLTGNRIFTLPDADSNSVRPLACSAGDFVSAVASTGILTCGTPAGSGTVTSSGPPLIHQLPIFTTATNITGLAVGASTGMYLRNVATADPVWSTLILPNAATQGALVVGTAANTWGEILDVAVGQVLASGGLGTVPAYTATPTVTSITAPTHNAGVASTTTGSVNLFNAASAQKLILQSASIATADRTVTFPDPGGADTVAYLSRTQTFGSGSTWNGVAVGFGFGGTGLASAADDTVMVSNGSAWVATAVNDCTGAGKALTYVAASNSFGCNTISGSGTVTSIATTSPITGGTITTTGTIACATCATTTNGGALTATAPIAISAGGVISVPEVWGVMTSDVTVTNSAALVNATGLVLPVSSSATEVWQFELQLLVTAAGSGNLYDLKLGWTFPAGVTMSWGPHELGAVGVFDPQGVAGAMTALSTQTATPTFGTTNGVVGGIYLRGWIFGGGTGGNVQLQFAEAAAVAATSVTLKKGSVLIARKLVN